MSFFKMQRTAPFQMKQRKGDLKSNINGWGGRDRTSEWRNQNPLPYRLATPQQGHRDPAEHPACKNPVRPRGSTEGGRPFQQQMRRNFPSRTVESRAVSWERP